MVQLYQHELLPITEATSECADPPEPLPSKTVRPPLNTGVIGEEKKEWNIYLASAFKKKVRLLGAAQGAGMLEIVPGGRISRQSAYEAGRDFLIKCSLSQGDYHLLFIPYEIMKKHGTYFLTPGNTKSAEQPRDKLALFMHFYFAFLNLYFQTRVTYLDKANNKNLVEKYFLCSPLKTNPMVV